MRTKALFLLTILLSPLVTRAESRMLLSPDGKLAVNVSVEQGTATYAITYDGQQMLMPSRLGLKTNIGDYTKGLSLKGAKTSLVEKHYDMTRTKVSHSDYLANQLDVTMTNAQGHEMMVTFLVSNNDVAFRYTLYRQEKDNPKAAIITGEASSFRLPDGTTTFLSPQSGPMVGWERTKPSYEEEYQADKPLTNPSSFGQGYIFPALFRLQTGNGNSWVLISETGVNGSYVGSHLSDWQSETGYSIAFPMAGENNGVGTPYAGISLPGSTPWRTITVGTSLAPIVETTLNPSTNPPKHTSQAAIRGRGLSGRIRASTGMTKCSSST